MRLLLIGSSTHILVHALIKSLIYESRIALRFLGFPLRKNSCVFGENKSAVDSSMTPYSKIRKRRTSLSFTRVRKTISDCIISYCFTPGSLNPAETLSKHESQDNVWHVLRQLFFGNETLWSYLKKIKLITWLLKGLLELDYIFYVLCSHALLQ